MNESEIKKHFSTLAMLPMSVDVDMPLHKAFDKAHRMLRKASRIYIIGNGGSAAIASHMAEDMTKNGGLRAITFNDAALITCFANDLGYENLFESAIRFYAERGDLLIAISSSGMSQNILRACNEAKDIGMKIITFSGFKPTNHLRSKGNLNFYVPNKSYGMVEITHLALLHAILDHYEG